MISIMARSKLNGKRITTIKTDDQPAPETAQRQLGQHEHR